MSTRTVVLSALATAAITVGVVEAYHAYLAKPQPQKKSPSKKPHSKNSFENNCTKLCIPHGRRHGTGTETTYSCCWSRGSWVLGRHHACTFRGEHLRIIDFDQVSLSSLNRHAVATLKDVGTPKVECIRTTCWRLRPGLTLMPGTNSGI
ncbi:hypothetical protein Cantr_03489 [Candida viswanathii]|uniref:THIF-type NAD/FAD binding fold domain-containing protein n=1 Tax=Candida viswanathii TaxID=5486 RepID=A0A367YN57_9ASCO|nr:hypothetical protein Cantr_03489 [Candida viswanathii]